MERITKIFLSFLGNHDQSYRLIEKMPPFSNSLQKLQDSLNDLKSEINKYRCPNCEFDFESYEDSDFATAAKPYEGGGSRNVCQNQSNQDKKEQAQKHTGSKSDKKHDKGFPSNEKKQLEDRILELEKERESLTLKNDEYKTKISEQESTMKKQLEDRILEIEKERESLALKNDDYTALISEQECTINQQFDEISRLRDADSKQESLNELEKTISEQQTKIARLEEAAKASAEEEQKLKRDISERDKQIENLNYTRKKNEEKSEESLQRLANENRSYIEKFRSCQSESEKLSAKLAEKDRINKDLTRRKSEIEEKCKQLERDLEQRSRKEIAVGFHTTLAPAMSSLILGGLTSRLMDRLAGEKVDLVRKAYSGSPDVNFPLLVVCVNVSRIGADAKEALKGIPKAKDVGLLVFHHKEAHALPSQTSDKILTGADFDGLGSIIDLAFLSQRGLYECDMNTVGIERVASFLLQYKTQRK